MTKLVRGHRLSLWYYKALKANDVFTLGGRSYDYFYHYHNRTWTNERAVEIPIARELISRRRGQRVLEVGNVLSRYFPIDHDVVDKYERRNGVIEEDIVDYRVEIKYDVIVSICTLEHVGWDERPRDKDKIPRAVENLKRLLNSGGEMLVTVPLGYNPFSTS